LNLKNFRIRTLLEFLKIAIPFTILIMVPVFIALFTAKNSEIEHNLMVSQNEVNHFRTEIERNLSSYIPNTTFLSRITAQILMGTENEQIALKQITRQLFFFSEKSERISQVRYIDATGKEVINLKRINNNIEELSQDQMQNKSSRDYFKKTMTLTGQVYISPVELNIENGVVELPYNPVIRIGSPVTGENGKTKGIIVINISMTPYLQKLRDLSLDTIGTIFVLNSRGYWLLGPSSEQEWGFMFEDRKGISLANQYPGVWDIISGGKGYVFESGTHYLFDTAFESLDSILDQQQLSQITMDEKIHVISIINQKDLYPSWWNMAVTAALTFHLMLLSVFYFIASVRIKRIVDDNTKKRLTERLELALSAGNTGIFDWDIESKKLLWDQNMLNLYNIKTKDFNETQEEWFNRIHPEDLKFVKETIIMDRKTDQDTSITFRILLPEGIVKYIRSDSVTHCNSEGKVTRIIGTNYDISPIIEAENKLRKFNEDLEKRIKDRTEELEQSNKTAIRIMQDTEIQKQKAEMALKELENSQISLSKSEKKFKELVENINEIIWETDTDGIITYMSPSVETITGVSLNKLLGNNILGFIPKDSVTAIRKILAYAAREKKPVSSFVYTVKHRDGREIQLEASLSPIINDMEEVVGFTGISRDITLKMEADVSLRKLSLAVEAAPVSVVITDGDGKIEYINPEFVNVTGYTEADILGENPRILKSGIHSDTFYKEMWDTISANKTWSGEICNKKKNGNFFWEQASISSIINSKGEITHYVAAKNDITEKKNIRSNLELTQFSVDNSSEPIFWVLSDASIYYVNNSTCEILGYSRKELLSKHIQELEAYVEHTTESWRKNLNKLRKEKVFTLESNMIRKNGEVFPVEVAHTHKVLDGKEFIFVNMRDISDRKEAQIAMENALRSAEESTRAKSSFLANMSHEIRTPMNAIIGMSYLAQQTELDKDQKDYINTINMSAKSLLDIINDILDFSKIEAGKLDIENIDFSIKDSIENIISISSQKISEKGLDLIINMDKKIPEIVTGDPVRFSQILTNLISNAVKFTDKGKVEIQTKLIKKNKNKVKIEFSISDTGIGLSKENANKLFESFSQADTSTTRKYGGTGLGLAITKQLVKLLDGEIKVESTEGTGSTFSFILSLYYKTEKQNTKELILPIEKTASFDNIRILVAEDNKINQIVVLELLKKVGVKVDIANDGNEALQMVQKDSYNILFMDIQMPEMDGLEATEHIRALGGVYSEIPIIAMTAHAMSGDRKKSLKAGMNDHITKPLDPRILYETISKWTEPALKQQYSTVQTKETVPDKKVSDMDFIQGQEKVLRKLK